MIQCTECIWETCSGQLRQFIRSRTANDAVAEDLLQDVFIKIHNRVATLQESSIVKEINHISPVMTCESDQVYATQATLERRCDIVILLRY